MRGAEKLQEILRLMHEEEVVKKIATAENPFKEYSVQRAKYSEKIKEFIILYKDTNYYDYYAFPYATSFFVFCIMIGHDIDWFIANKEEFLSRLKKEEDNQLEKISSSMARYVYFISDYCNNDRVEELINQIFC